MRPTRLVVLALIAACKQDNGLVEQQYQDPTLELTTPAPAEWAPAGTMKAAGRASNLDGITVAEQPAPPADGQFTTEIELRRGVNLVEAAGLDMRGDRHFVRNGVLAGEFKDPQGDIADAAAIRVNQGGLDVILDAAEPMMDVYAIAPLIINPVYTYTYEIDLGFFEFEVVKADVYLTEIWYDQPQLSADPRPGILNVNGVIPNLMTKVYVYADVGGWFSVDATIDVTADSVIMDLPMTLQARQRRIEVGLNTPTTTISGFYFDTDLIPYEIEGALLSGFLEGYLEDTLPGMMATMIPPIIEEKLAGLDLSYEMDLMGKPLSVEAGFSDARVDDDGIALAVDIAADIPGGGDLPYEGFLTADEFGEEPEPDHFSDVSMSLYDDLLNRVMFEAWSAGMLEITMSSADGSLSPLMLLPLQATEGVITISGQLPPVIVGNDAGELEAQLGEMLLTIDTPDGALGTHLVAAVTVLVPLEVGVDGGVLALNLGDPVFNITVRESDWGASNDTVTNLLEESLPVDAMLGMLGNFSFPLPELAGISVASGEASRDGQVHTGVAVSLE